MSKHHAAAHHPHAARKAHAAKRKALVQRVATRSRKHAMRGLEHDAGRKAGKYK